jgi:DNA-binding NtrC family response regulator
MSEQASVSDKRLGEQSSVGGLRVLIVDDEQVFANAVTTRLQRAGYACRPAGTLLEAQRLLEVQVPDLLLLDLQLPDGNGLDFLRNQLVSLVPQLAVVVITAHGDLTDAVAAMKLGAVDYLKKPIDLDELLLVIDKLQGRLALEQRLEYSRQREARSAVHEELVGESESMVRLRSELERIGAIAQRVGEGAPPTVLITGETGTGKDLAARLLHEARDGGDNLPFVHLDCAALPASLIEAELFGHERGSFTGATGARIGLIEAAEAGTLFLNEVGELPPDLQAKLLTVLERRVLRRVGGNKELPVRAWILAATNRDLERMVAEGTFRGDLLYRLKVLDVPMPALRERGEDVVRLAHHFANQVARRYDMPEPHLDGSAIEALGRYSWPGNVRELKHAIERAVLLCRDGRIGHTDLPMPGAVSEAAPPGGEVPGQIDGLTLQEAEVLLIKQALEATQGNVSRAARQLGVTRMALRYRIDKYDLREWVGR